MNVIHIFRIARLIAAIAITGCASFEPALRTPDFLHPRQPTVAQAQDGLEISVEEFASANKSRQAFDADIASSGILALLVRAENKGARAFKIARHAITAHRDGQPLTPISGVDAANQSATSEYAGKALGWTLATGPFAILLWPATIAGSAAHTQSVNRRIQQHFESVQLSDALIKTNQATTGFVYFKLPGQLKQLEALTMELIATEENNNTSMQFQLALPTVTLQ